MPGELWLPTAPAAQEKSASAPAPAPTLPIERARLVEAANAQLPPLLARLDADDLTRDECVALIAALEKACRYAGRPELVAYARSKRRVVAFLARATFVDAASTTESIDDTLRALERAGATLDDADVRGAALGALRADNLRAWRALVASCALRATADNWAYVDALVRGACDTDDIAVDCARRVCAEALEAPSSQRAAFVVRTFDAAAAAVRARAYALATRLCETGALLARATPPTEVVTPPSERAPVLPPAPVKRARPTIASESSSSSDDDSASYDDITSSSSDDSFDEPAPEPPRKRAAHEHIEYGGRTVDLTAKNIAAGMTRGHVELLVDTFEVDESARLLPPTMAKHLAPLYGARSLSPFPTTQVLTRVIVDVFGEAATAQQGGRRVYRLRVKNA